ncbi:MAG: hypothetical protein GY834_02025 [Bacteroidetes bacterium]|nr:hypothetical protein [Bacteroidota bacterium]
MRIEGKENICEVFSIFHDGDITYHEISGNNLLLEIEIQYLAQRIDETFIKFILTLNNICNISFEPWLDETDEGKVILTKLEEIFNPELEILSAEKQENKIKVACSKTEKS